MDMKKLFAGSMLVAASTAQASVVDYSSLQDLFGEPVTLSATGKPQRASDAPASMEIIDAETIRRSGAQNITDVLRRATSVSVRSGFKGNADVSIRGMNQAYSNRLLVLINGRQMYQDHYGVTFWDMLPVQLSEIQQIEIVRGPNTALFGFNAASGVINIVTYSPLLKDVDEVTARIGTQNYTETNAVLTHKISDNSAVRISAGMKDGDDYSRDTMQTPISETNAISGQVVNVDFQSTLKNGGVVSTELNHGYSRGDLYSPPGAGRSARHTTSIKGEYSKDTDFGLVSLSAYYNSFNEDLDLGSLGSPLGVFEIDNDLYVVKGELLKKLNADHTLRVAAEYRRNNINSNLTDEDELDNLYYDVYSVSTMWDWQVNSKLSWTNSLRFDHLKLGRDDEIDPNITASPIGGLVGLSSKESYSRRIDEVSFNTGLLYKHTDKDTFRASIARGLRVPALLQLGNTSLRPDNIALLTSPQTELEVNMTYEVGYTRKLPELNGEIGANIFHQRISDVIGIGVIPASPTTDIGGTQYTVISEFNLGDTESVGVELFMNANPTENLEYGFNYTYNIFEDESDSRTAAIQPLTTSTSQNKHQATVWSRYTMGKWELDGALHYVSKALYPGSVLPDEQVDDYFVLNTRVGYNLTDATSIALDGVNLLEEHNEWGQSALLGNGANELGRSVFLTINHKF